MSQDTHEFDELERAMRKLPLRAPSPELDQQVMDAIARPRASMWRIGIFGGALAAAALVMLVLWLVKPMLNQKPGELLATTNPASSSGIVITETTESWKDEGVVGYAANGPVRQYSVQTVEQFASADGEPRTFTQESVVQYVADTY